MLALLFLLVNGVKSTETSLGQVTVSLSSGGSLEGTKWDIDGTKVDTYLGIPFAEPPVEDLRFAPPKPLKPLQGTYAATRLPNTCWQYIPSGFDIANAGARIWVNNTQMSEDCLYLNVWAPADRRADSPLPVMIWIFGGGFFAGTSTLDVYDGRFLAAKENVIVVSMQYRLGVFGFLHLKDNVEGNMGLLDQRAAMEWVQQHIASFGGDPDRVTLFGESAGAASIAFHYLMPESRRLFRRMILQSAGPFHRWAISDAKTAHDTGLAFIKANNCSDVDGHISKEIDCLRKLDPQQLVDTLYDLNVASTARREQHLETMRPRMRPAVSLSSGAQYFEVMAKPVIDGRILPDCPTTLLKSMNGESQPDVLIGNMQNEGMYWLFYGLGIDGIQFLQDDGGVNFPNPSQLQSTKVDFIQLVANRFISLGYLTKAFSALTALQYGMTGSNAKKITNYESNLPKNKVGPDFIEKLDDLSGELDFVCGTKLFARLLVGIRDANVQYYNFEHKSKNVPFPAKSGAMHGYEIEYIFGMPFSEKFQKEYYTFTPEEKQLSIRVMRYWANFARSGFADQNPDGSFDEIRWPRLTPLNDPYMVISLETPNIKKDLHSKGCTYWNDIFPSLTRIQLKKSGYRDLDQTICPHLETNLFAIKPLRDFVPGIYYGEASTMLASMFTYWLFVLMTVT